MKNAGTKTSSRIMSAPLVITVGRTAVSVVGQMAWDQLMSSQRHWGMEDVMGQRLRLRMRGGAVWEVRV